MFLWSLPATSSNGRPFLVNLTFPIPLFTKDHSHGTGFEASQRRLGRSVRLQKAAFWAPKRCTTPLLPFHTIPGYSDDEDEIMILAAPKQPWDESCDFSPPSSPSLSLHTPLSTSNALHTADPFVSHGDSFYTPPGRMGLLSSPFAKVSDDISLMNQLSIKPDLTTLAFDTLHKHPDGPRQFCGCKNPCSNYVSISPTLETFPTTGSNNMRNELLSSDAQQKRNIGSQHLPEPPARRTMLENSVLGGLELVLPELSLELWQQDLDASETSGPTISTTELKPEKVIAKPPQTFRRSDVYDSWMSSWCFRPAILRSPNVPLPGILASSSPKLGLEFLPSSTSSPRVSTRNTGLCDSGFVFEQLRPHGLTYHSPFGISSRNSRVLSGMNKLQNLRELLVILDQTMATSAVSHTSRLSSGRDKWRDLDWEDTGSVWRLGSEAIAGRAF